MDNGLPKQRERRSKYREMLKKMKPYKPGSTADTRELHSKDEYHSIWDKARQMGMKIKSVTRVEGKKIVYLVWRMK